jgi:hypothetical protein
MNWPSESVVDALAGNGGTVTKHGPYAYFDKGDIRLCATRIGRSSYIVEASDCGPEIYSEDAMVDLVRSL